jgi:hypothetical protein
MTIITRPKIAEIRRDIIEALADVGVKHGLKLDTGNATFTSTSLSLKLEMTSLGEGGVERDLDAEAFTKFASLEGLDPSDLGKPIKLQGKPFTIAGYRPKARKNCITVKSPAGKVFVTSADTVKRALAKVAV